MSDKLYCKVINGNQVSEPLPLPICYNNISNFFALDDVSVSDLSWAGYTGEGFWLTTFDTKPDYSVDQRLTIDYTLNPTNKTCHVSYKVENMIASDLDVRKENLRQQIRVIRDRYLSLTDFTQISDVPFSSQVKAEFAAFRQQLRDLPSANDPSSITWPSIPNSVNINLPPFPPVPTYKI